MAFLLICLIIEVLQFCEAIELPPYTSLSTTQRTQVSGHVYREYKVWVDHLLASDYLHAIQTKDPFKVPNKHEIIEIEREMRITTEAWHNILDRIFHEFFHTVREDYPFGENYYAIIARCGSFGRNELLPTSDIDICTVLIDSDKDTRTAAQSSRALFERLRAFADNYLKILNGISESVKVTFEGYDEMDDIIYSSTRSPTPPGVPVRFFYDGARNAQEFYKTYLSGHANEIYPPTDIERITIHQGFWSYATLPFLDAAPIMQYPPVSTTFTNKWHPFITEVMRLFYTTPGDLEHFADIVMNLQLPAKMEKGVHKPKTSTTTLPPLPAFVHNAKYAIIKPLTFATHIFALTLFEGKRQIHVRAAADPAVGRWADFDEELRQHRPHASLFEPLTGWRMDELVKEGVLDKHQKQIYYDLFLTISTKIFWGNIKFNVMDKDNAGVVKYDVKYDHGKPVKFMIAAYHEVKDYLEHLEQAIPMSIKKYDLKKMSEWETLWRLHFQHESLAFEHWAEMMGGKGDVVASGLKAVAEGPHAHEVPPVHEVISSPHTHVVASDRANVQPVDIGHQDVTYLVIEPRFEYYTYIVMFAILFGILFCIILVCLLFNLFSAAAGYYFRSQQVTEKSINYSSV